MTTPKHNLATPDNRRRWKLQFSLRAFLVATALLAVCFGYVGKILYHARKQQAIVARIESLGGSVCYDDENLFGQVAPNPSATSRLLRSVLGKDASSRVRKVFVGFNVHWDFSFHAQSLPAKPEPPSATNADLAMLSELPELIDVVVDKPPVDDEGMQLLARIPKLHNLDLNSVVATGDGLAQLRAAPLEWLSLEGASVSDETIRRISELSRLKYLRLAGTSVSSAGLFHLNGLDDLREIEFYGGANIFDDGLRHLTGLPNLEALNLMGTRISDEGLVHLRNLPRLNEVGLNGIAVSDDGLRHLVEIPGLKKLNLAYAPITDSGLAMLARLPDLEELYLFDTTISDEGAVHIAKLKQLRILRTEGTNITEAGLFLLRNHRRLETLSVGPDVTPDAMTELKAMLPKCDVEYRSSMFRPQPKSR